MLSRRRYILGLAGAAGLAALSWRLLPRSSVSPGHVARRALSLPLAPSGWPYAWGRLVAPAAAFPDGFGVRRVFLDAGHGAPGNTGNTSCSCVDEQDFTLDAASALGERDYAGLYAADAAQAGVFVDRHAPEQRIYVLRRPSMPSILVETHHALDACEAARWTEPATHDAFAAAVAAALEVLASS